MRTCVAATAALCRRRRPGFLKYPPVEIIISSCRAVISTTGCFSTGCFFNKHGRLRRRRASKARNTCPQSPSSSSPFTILHSSFFILHFPNVRHNSVLHRGSRGNRCCAQSAYYLCMRNKMPAFPRNRYAAVRIIFLDLPASAHALQAGQFLITTLFFLFTCYRSDARETPVPQPHYPLLPSVNRCFPAGSILIGHPKAYRFATCRYCFRHLSDLDSGDKRYRQQRQTIWIAKATVLTGKTAYLTDRINQIGRVCRTLFSHCLNNKDAATKFIICERAVIAGYRQETCCRAAKTVMSGGLQGVVRRQSPAIRFEAIMFVT